MSLVPQTTAVAGHGGRAAGVRIAVLAVVSGRAPDRRHDATINAGDVTRALA
jgi:hypothetical protein